MKQTAVEWLVEQFNTTINYTLEEYQLKIEQAKAMEKEQITDAYDEGAEEWCDGFYVVDISSESYYNKTFKSE